jgi:hypothetical protein
MGSFIVQPLKHFKDGRNSALIFIVEVMDYNDPQTCQHCVRATETLKRTAVQAAMLGVPNSPI